MIHVIVGGVIVAIIIVASKTKVYLLKKGAFKPSFLYQKN